MSEDKPIHREKYEGAKKEMMNEEDSQDLSRIFKVLSDPTKVKIVSALSKGEACVHDLALLLGISQSAVSHQLRILKEGRIVKFRKTGRTVFYSLDDEHVEKLLQVGKEHIEE